MSLNFVQVARRIESKNYKLIFEKIFKFVFAFETFGNKSVVSYVRFRLCAYWRIRNTSRRAFLVIWILVKAVFEKTYNPAVVFGEVSSLYIALIVDTPRVESVYSQGKPRKGPEHVTRVVP